MTPGSSQLEEEGGRRELLGSSQIVLGGTQRLIRDKVLPET